MSTILSIDPGTTHSAWMTYRDGKPQDFGKDSNEALTQKLWEFRQNLLPSPEVVVVEMVASYGMPVGREVFETVAWIGRFEATFGTVNSRRLYRKDIKLHLCGSTRAKDGNVRQALIDRFGGKAAAIGLKKAPGPLYGISKDVWSALAIAVTFADKTRAVAV